MLINKDSLVLCVCQYGHSRSVAMARALHARGFNAIAAGTGTAGDWLQFACAKADYIIVMDSALLPYIPEVDSAKLSVCDVGPDRWVNPYHQELQGIINEWLSNQT